MRLREWEYLSELREAILKTSYRLFIEAGYQRASIRRIAEECSCNVAAVYYHFGSKEKLFGEVFDTFSPFTAVSEAIERDPLPGDAGPDAAVKHLAGAAFRAIRDNLPAYSLLLTDVREFGGANLRRGLARDIRAAVAKSPPHPVGALLARLDLREGLDPASFMRMLMVLVFSVAVIDYFGGPLILLPGNQATAFQKPPQEVLDQTCEVLLHGALAGPPAGLERRQRVRSGVPGARTPGGRE